ncbi:MAG: glycosyltransferase family 2 protein [Bacillota bacterium]
MSRVLIASPVRQKPDILREFLLSLDRLEKTGLQVSYAFVDDHDAGSYLLRRFASEKAGVRIIPAGNKDPYLCDETTHHWRAHLIRKVAGYKDRLIETAREEDFDYLFLLDSDLVLHPKTLVHLVGLGKDIVSEVYWTRWMPDMPPLPQVWLGGQYRMFHVKPGETPDEGEVAARQQEFLDMLKIPGTYKVGGLGACTLISRKALLQGVSFREIYNLDLIGEDRHFCVRAAALGLDLYADTHYPPYHIYRESDLAGLENYKKTIGPVSTPAGKRGGKITLAMLVRNEAGRFLERVLAHAAGYIDSAVILDDASEDETAKVCRRALKGVPLTLVSNEKPMFENEIVLRKQLWQLATDTGPDWILILDADELFEDKAVREIPLLASNPEVEAYYFRLYDMWSETHYREDRFWQAHLLYRPFMVRHIPGFTCLWRETPQHCGRFPANITDLKGEKSQLRIRHLGWMRPEDRLAKYYRYKKMDPGGRYGSMEQYLSILDPKPGLKAWD